MAENSDEESTSPPVEDMNSEPKSGAMEQEPKITNELTKSLEISPEDIEDTETERPFLVQLAISLSLFFGPICLSIAMLWSRFLWGLGVTLIPLFGLITFLLVASMVYRAWVLSKEMK